MPQRFILKLYNVQDPEKRKIIGKLFISIFEKEARKYKNIKFLHKEHYILIL